MQVIGEARVIEGDELPHSGSTRKFEGYLYGGTNVSFFLVDTPPGSGPRLHRHPYEEVFVVQEGNVTFTVEGETVEASAGQIVIVPAGAAHTFVNSGAGPLRQIDIHPTGRMEQVDIPIDA